MSVLVEHMMAMRQQFIIEHGKAPGTLALGRWDARELAVYYAKRAGDITPSRALRVFRHGAWAMGAEVKVDGRLGRCPGALWWQP